ncbi:MAG TPA: peptidoglycan-binding protein [Clostridia bacterium]|nr:peptidoglycan-binding protein [Clostridia bacterium]
MNRKKRGVTLVMAVTVILVAGLVLSTAMPVQAATYPVLRLGSRGQAVSRLQQALKNGGYFTYPKITDYYGTITRDAVTRFQRDYGLYVDGIAGQKTQTALYGGNTGTGYTGSLYFGMYNERVRDLQNALKGLGYFRGTATAYYGHVTENAVIAFQIDYRLKIDGIAGPQTQGVLFGGKPAGNSTADRNALTAKQRDDIFWLARIIHAESQGESYTGKVAVGNVIMNRVSSNQFPNTIYNVIFEYYYNIPQFSPVEDGTIYNNPSAECIKAAEEAYWGSKPVGSALYFFNPRKAAGSWIVNNRQYITSIGSHAFYR